MRQDNELTRLLEDRNKKVYDAVTDEMVTAKELAKRREARENHYATTNYLCE